ncbi:hypothetical protein ABW20_dc0102144 [Dactylellina cionopaga]|nr:hypothetical protein ABW20_dc0102144 [Dactylellina cionopaga]
MPHIIEDKDYKKRQHPDQHIDPEHYDRIKKKGNFMLWKLGIYLTAPEFIAAIGYLACNTYVVAIAFKTNNELSVQGWAEGEGTTMNRFWYWFFSGDIRPGAVHAPFQPIKDWLRVLSGEIEYLPKDIWDWATKKHDKNVPMV